MSATAVLLTVIAYFAAMMVVSWLSGRGNDNAGFFTGSRKSKWWTLHVGPSRLPVTGSNFCSAFIDLRKRSHFEERRNFVFSD